MAGTSACVIMACMNLCEKDSPAKLSVGKETEKTEEGKALITIYTDGACSNNQSNQNFGGWAAILVYNDYRKDISGYEMDTTNNRMEMRAVIEALKLLKRYDLPICLFSDSAYIVNCINEKWYVKWKRNGWKNSKKEDVLNRDLWEELLHFYEKFRQIRFIKVKGHLNLNNQSELKKSFEQYKKYFGQEVGMEEYKQHISFNHLVDELAVKSAEQGRTMQ